MDVIEFIREGRYENKVPSSIEPVPVDEDKMTVRQAREHKEEQKRLHREQRDKRWAEDRRLRDVFQADLEMEHGVSGHPKAGRLFEIAWERGHSEGLTHVAYCYAELAELIAA